MGVCVGHVLLPMALFVGAVQTTIPSLTCTHEPMPVTVTEFTRISSPNYPLNIFDAPGVESCWLVFKVPASQILNLAFTNGNIGNMLITNPFGNSSASVSTDSAPFMDAALGLTMYEIVRDDGWNAFQGYVYPSNNSDTNNCSWPDVEVLSEFDLQILLTVPQTLQLVSCRHTFTVPSNAIGFKVVVRTIKLVAGSEFEIVNGTGHVIVRQYGDEPALNDFLAYSSDQNITVQYSHTTPYATELDSVMVLIGIVRHSPAVTENACPVREVPEGASGTTEWSALDARHGYAPDSQCTFNRSVPRDALLFFRFPTFQLEFLADFVLVSLDAGGQWRPVAAGNNVNDMMQAAPVPGHSLLLFRYHADGSVAQIGFAMRASVVPCRCSQPNVVIPCQGSHKFAVLDDFTGDPNSWGFFCPNMTCTYSILYNDACPDRLIYFEAENKPASASMFELLVDSKPIMTVSDAALVQHGRNVTLNFSSFTSLPDHEVYKSPWFKFIVSSRQNPSFVNRTLTTETPSFVFRLDNFSVNSFLLIQLDAAIVNDSIEIFISQTRESFKDFSFYDFTDDGFVFDNSFSSKSKQEQLSVYVKKGPVIAIYRDSVSCNQPIAVFARAQATHSRHCLFPNNVLLVADCSSVDSACSVVSRPSGTCPLVLLNEKLQQPFVINSLWTDAVESVQLVDVDHSGVPLLHFNSSTLDTYSNLLLNLPAVAVDVARGVAVVLHLQDSPRTDVSVYDVNFRSVVAIEVPTTTSVSYHVSNDICVDVTATALSNCIVNITINWNCHVLTSVGQSLTVCGDNFLLGTDSRNKSNVLRAVLQVTARPVATQNATGSTPSLSTKLTSTGGPATTSASQTSSQQMSFRVFPSVLLFFLQILTALANTCLFLAKIP